MYALWRKSLKSITCGFDLVFRHGRSEGESAFTPDFKGSVDKATLMVRRLEAGTINTGLSQLQVIFNELRFKGVWEIV